VLRSSSKSRSFAKSAIVQGRFAPLDPKSASYPNVDILAFRIVSSFGSHNLGQNRSGLPSLAQVRWLLPPRPCTSMICAIGVPSGSCRTVSPKSSRSGLNVLPTGVTSSAALYLVAGVGPGWLRRRPLDDLNQNRVLDDECRFP
jgi:hypothetical protein